MDKFLDFFTIFVLFSLSSAQSINDFFADDVDAGLVSFNPIDISQSQGIFGTNNQQGEDSIGGIFADEELTGRDAIDGFSVGQDLFVGGGGDQNQGNAVGVPRFGNTFQDNVIDTVPTYGSAGQIQQQFQQNLLDLFK